MVYRVSQTSQDMDKTNNQDQFHMDLVSELNADKVINQGNSQTNEIDPNQVRLFRHAVRSVLNYLNGVKSHEISVVREVSM